MSSENKYPLYESLFDEIKREALEARNCVENIFTKKEKILHISLAELEEDRVAVNSEA